MSNDKILNQAMAGSSKSIRWVVLYEANIEYPGQAAKDPQSLKWEKVDDKVYHSKDGWELLKRLAQEHQNKCYKMATNTKRD